MSGPLRWIWARALRSGGLVPFWRHGETPASNSTRGGLAVRRAGESDAVALHIRLDERDEKRAVRWWAS
jgi:hypothetical protein